MELRAPPPNSTLRAGRLSGGGVGRLRFLDATALSASSGCASRRRGRFSQGLPLLRGPESRGAAVEPGKVVMEQRPRRRARGGVRPVSGPVPPSRPPAPRRAAEPPGTQLWLFPSAAGLRRALSQRMEATRQMCCTRGRLVVLERGGAGVEVHQLTAGSDGAKKPSEWGGQCPLGPPVLGWGCGGGRPGAPECSACGTARWWVWRSFSKREGTRRRGPDAAAACGGCRNALGRVAFEFRGCERLSFPLSTFPFGAEFTEWWRELGRALC